MAGYTTSEGIELRAEGLDVQASLFCGQSFAWQAGPAGGFTGVAGVRAVWVKQCGPVLYIKNLSGEALLEEDAAFWWHYFALEEDYPAMLARFSEDSALAACVAMAPGLRVLRQPFWEVLLQFILSQNNNIKRIAGLVGRLRRLYGPALAGGEHGFPPPRVLAAMRPEDLAGLGAGYRAAYLIDAAQAMAEGRVSEDALRALDDDKARTLLCSIKGVGPKVASCVLLFGLGRSDVVPMDVWMKRAQQALFPQGLPACAAGCRGLAQQYIFVWARQHLK